MQTPNAHRLNILTPSEIKDLYGLPQFGDQERQQYFEMSAQEHQSVEQRRAAIGIFQVLELGYFKAKRQFFAFELSAVLPDLRYLARHYFPGLEVNALTLPSKPTRVLIQRAVLELLTYQPCGAAAKEDLLARLQRNAALSTQPAYILRDALEYLAQKRLVALQYTTLQDMVGGVIASEGLRVTQLLELHAPEFVLKSLDALLFGDENILTLTDIKHEPRNFGLKEMRREVERRQHFQPLHEFAQTFLTTAGLSQESGKYYASLVKY